MAQAAARAETLPQRVHAAAGGGADGDWDDFADALEDDFDTPRALAVMHDWASARQHELLAEALEIFGLESLAERERPPAGDRRARRAARAARAERDFEEADRLRDEIAAAGLGDARRPTAATCSCRRP